MDQYTPDIVANAFLYKARIEGAQNPHMTHMKLQKLAFFMHAWGLALYGASPVAERPEAWDYGPVFSSLYHALKSYGKREIADYLLQMNPTNGQREALIPVMTDTQFWGLLEQVWRVYGGFNALQLSQLTHESGSPWEQARNHGNGWLDDQAVAEFYRSKMPANA